MTTSVQVFDAEQATIDELTSLISCSYFIVTLVRHPIIETICVFLTLLSQIRVVPADNSCLFASVRLVPVYKYNSVIY